MERKDNSKIIAQRIMWILKSKKMSQNDLANMMGKNCSEISRWLSGRCNFTIATLEKIERALGRKIVVVVGKRIRDD